MCDIMAMNSKEWVNFHHESMRGNDDFPKDLNIYLDFLQNCSHSQEVMETLSEFLDYNVPKWSQ